MSLFASLGIKVDAAEIEEMSEGKGEFKRPEKGSLQNVVITEVTTNEAPSGAIFLEAKMDVLDGDCKGSWVKFSQNIVKTNKDQNKVGLSYCATLCKAVGVPFDTFLGNPNAIVGKNCTVTIKYDTERDPEMKWALAEKPKAIAGTAPVAKPQVQQAQVEQPQAQVAQKANPFA